MKLLWRSFVRGVFKILDLDSPYTAQEYGVNWTKQKRKCLERDDYTCRVCRATKSEIGRRPAVHHIKPRAEFEDTPFEMNALSNLVTLCPKCHGRLEGKFQECDVNEFIQQAKVD